MVPVAGQIAAIARSRGMAVATRNVWDFEDMGIDLYNPWGTVPEQNENLSCGAIDDLLVFDELNEVLAS